jgi:predicted hydrocarbon binding protein
MGRILRMAAEEVLGEDGLRRVLEACNVSCKEIGDGWKHLPASQFAQSLEEVFSVQAGRGMALRIGRACFPYGLREYGNALGLNQASFRLLPSPRKLTTLSAAMSNLMQQGTGQGLVMEETDGKLLWHMHGCPLCHERHTDGPACHLAVGLAEEALYWLSSGKMFQVDESACIARGDPHCTLQIDATPLS